MGVVAANREIEPLDAHIDPVSLATYRAALQAFVSRRVHDPDEVQDLVQEACIRLIQSNRSQPVQQPQAYLFRIAANLIIDRYRRVAHVHPLDEQVEPATRAEQEDGQRYIDLQDALADALRELPPRCREVFLLRRFDELSTTAVALRLRITPRMVQKHLGRAVAHLYIRLGPIWSER